MPFGAPADKASIFVPFYPPVLKGLRLLCCTIVRSGAWVIMTLAIAPVLHWLRSSASAVAGTAAASAASHSESGAGIYVYIV